MANKQMSTTTKTMLGALAGMGGAVTSLTMGANSGSMESAWTLLGLLCAVFIPLCVGGIVADRKRNQAIKRTMLAKESTLVQIANKYNAVTDMLENAYDHELQQLGWFSSQKKEELRQDYEQRYYQNKQAYEQERNQYLATLSDDTPISRQFKRYWKWVISTGLLAQLMACSYTMGSSIQEDATNSASAMLDAQEARLWNAENIPMPHLTDGSRYVSNPDNIVTANTEQQLNLWMKKLDDSLQVESAVIIVNHVENDDPFRMAQDVGNRYGVGRNDRGLIVVLAYGDHAINISPGRSLEADLTDVECRRLQQEYVVPSMKAELPDSGMLYLAEAIYNTLQKKDLPQMLALAANANSDEDEGLGLMSIYIFMFCGWGILISYLNNRYNGNNGRNMFAANPFAKTPNVIVTSGGRGFGGGFGGGGFSGGGGYGGGSFGGGGATSRW